MPHRSPSALPVAHHSSQRVTMRTGIVLLFAALASVGVHAQDASVRFGVRQAQPNVPRSDKDPYRNLFKTAPPPAPDQSPQPSREAPKVVCGTLIIPADPKIDPGINIDPYATRPDMRYTIRRLTPPICKPE